MFQPPSSETLETDSSGQPSPQQRVASSLQPDEIILDTELRERRRVLEAAAGAIARKHGLDAAPIFRALWRREQVGSTALGQGVAIPHARIEGIDRPITVFLRPRFAVHFDAPDGKPARCFLVILVPANGDTDEHLGLLALVAEMFADGGVRRRLINARVAAEVAKVIFNRLGAVRSA